MTNTSTLTIQVVDSGELSDKGILYIEYQLVIVTIGDRSTYALRYIFYNVDEVKFLEAAEALYKITQNHTDKTTGPFISLFQFTQDAPLTPNFIAGMRRLAHTKLAPHIAYTILYTQDIAVAASLLARLAKGMGSPIDYCVEASLASKFQTVLMLVDRSKSD